MSKDQRIDLGDKAREQPKDKDRAQTAHKTDRGKMPPQKVEQEDDPQK
jgi:hypothetical protein